MFESILCQVSEYDPDVLEPLIGFAGEIAREGRYLDAASRASRCAAGTRQPSRRRWG